MKEATIVELYSNNHTFRVMPFYKIATKTIKISVNGEKDRYLELDINDLVELELFISELIDYLDIKVMREKENR